MKTEPEHIKSGVQTGTRGGRTLKKGREKSLPSQRILFDNCYLLQIEIGRYS